MNLATSSLRSRFARRIFLQFVVCAIVPVAALAVLSFGEVSSLVRQIGREQLNWQSKAVGMETLSQLHLCAAQLQAVARPLTAAGPSTPDQRRAGTLPGACFSGFAVLGPHASVIQFWPQEIPLPAHSMEQRSRLADGRAVLTTATSASHQPRIWLSRGLGANEVLSGLVNPEYLWNAESLPEFLELCVVDSSAAVLHCPDQRAASLLENLRLQKADAARGEFEWRKGKAAFLSGYWAVFLQSEYGAPSWKVVVTESMDDVLDPLNRFRSMFPLAIVLALSVVFLLSLIQIRRSLAPLERLREGTERIAHRDFVTQVHVRSGDEFEQLAASFNAMSAELGVQFDKLDRLNLGTLTALARAIDAKSRWTSGHSERVTHMAMRIGQEMGLPQKELDTLHRGGLLHDIGKIATPAEILNKPGKLTDEEMSIMRDHVRQGARILEPLPGFEDVMPIVLEHHEWFNGRGYPAGLKGQEISLHGRIFGVADVFDALISDRPYRPGWDLPRVVSYIREGAGTQFDPEVVRIFVEMMAREQAAAGSAPPVRQTQVQPQVLATA